MANKTNGRGSKHRSSIPQRTSKVSTGTTPKNINYGSQKTRGVQQATDFMAALEPYKGFTPPSLLADENLVTDLQALDQLWNPPPSIYVDDPLGWVHNVAHVETWSKQDEIYQAVNSNRYVAVKSCHGPGKSFTAANLICWWLANKPDPFVVTSAPTSHQVRTILWREIRRGQSRPDQPLPGKITQGQVPEWKDPSGEIIAFGRKPADYLDQQEAASAFQGIHAQSLLVVLDEGSGIPDWLANACENLITNEESCLLIIGNPDNPVSYFARAFKPGSDFYQITISAFDTPNFTEERHNLSQNLLARLTSRIWVEERLKRWGEHSPLYIAKVLAEFPTVTDDTVFTPAHMAQGIATDLPSPYFPITKNGQIPVRNLCAEGSRLGMDVSRLGTDETVVYQNFGGQVRLVGRWGKKDTMATVGAYRRLLNNGNTPTTAPPTVIDVNGLGAGVYDRLKELGYPVIPFNGGERAYDPTKYKNRRSEAFWAARELFEQGAIDIENEDEDLQAELLEHHFKDTSSGLKQIESKEDIIARLGRSPDRADAFVMSLQRGATIQETFDTNQRRKTTKELRHEPEYARNIPRRPSPAANQRTNVDEHMDEIVEPTITPDDIMSTDF